jgi:predicted PurR-regulated permease PerM
MPPTTDPADEPGGSAHGGGIAGRDTTPSRRSRSPAPMPRLGVWSWGFVGVVAATIIIVVALAAVSEIVLPMTFAAVLAVIFKPLASTLQRHRWKPSLAAGVILLCLLAVTGGVVVATVRGVIQQADQISAVTDKALNNAADLLDAAGIDKAALNDARAATEGAAPMIANGFLTKVISGVGSLIGLVSGIILGALIMYYLLKDGTSLRRSLVARIRDPSLRGDVDDFISDTCRILREYGRAQTIMATIVAVVIGLAALLLGLPLVFTIIVVNFVGGYIPYIGAFLGGGLAVIVALGDGGLPKAAVMLIVVLAANLVLENFIQPKVMSRTLAIHPLVVLIVTALGGLLGGMVGLILAVPAYVIASDAISRFRSRGLAEKVAGRAQPTVQRLLD